jgi:acyl-CoA thioesterase II
MTTDSPHAAAAAASDEARVLAELLDVLSLEAIETNVFRGSSPKDRWQRVFGGQVLGQALVAAQRTVNDRVCHSLHAYFLRGGDPKVPILYEVDRSRDGHTFTARRVVAIQHGRPIFTMSASFQIPEEGLEHQITMPEVPMPETLKTEREWRQELVPSMPEETRAWFLRPRPIEIRPVSPANRFAPGAHRPEQIVWVRALGSLGAAEHALHQCILAYASDMTILDTSLLPHGFTLFSPGLQLASLDHAMWFHRPFRADEWLLYVQESPTSSGGRGFNRGTIFRRDGTLVASVAQEGLIRRRTAPAER